MRKISKLARKALAKASDTFIKFVILPLMQWASEDSNRFFFIVIGDQYNVDCAYANTENLACEGAFAIVNTPQTAGALTSIWTSVDILLEDSRKDEEFEKNYQNTIPSKDDTSWYSITL